MNEEKIVERIGRYFDTRANVIYVGIQDEWIKEYPQSDIKRRDKK